MAGKQPCDHGLSRRKFLKVGAAGLAGGLLLEGRHGASASPAGDPTQSQIYHSVNGTPAQNVAQVFDMAYGGIENFIGQDDVVLLRPNLQWYRNGYTNSEIGKAMIDLILNRPGGFTGEIIVIENQQRGNPHTNAYSGWCTTDRRSNGLWNWFEMIQYYVDHQGDYPDGIHTDPVTGRINVSFQFLMDRFSFTLEDPHEFVPAYAGESYAGAYEIIDAGVDPFPLFKNDYSTSTCFYVRRSDLVYSNAIARVSPLNDEPLMSYPVFKSQHSGLYVSLYKDHSAPWDPESESFTGQSVKLVNMATLNHHSDYAGVTSVVKAHFGIVWRTYHWTGWHDADPSTFYYAGGPIGYWLATIRQPDLHMSCAERIGLLYRTESNAYQARAVAISTDPVALDYHVGKYILFPAGEQWGHGGSGATSPQSNDPSLEGGFYGLTLEFCRDPLADHSIINGTLNEDEMDVHLFDFDALPGDFNADGHVDLADYEHMQGCIGGPNAAPAKPDCDAADFNGDSDVDLADYDTFLAYFTGTN